MVNPLPAMRMIFGLVLMVLALGFVRAGLLSWTRFRTATLAQKIRKLVSALLVTFMFGYFAYGALAYSDAPIRPCASGYCGKSGAVYSAQDYQNSRNFERGLLILWPAGMIVLLGLRFIGRTPGPQARSQLPR